MLRECRLRRPGARGSGERRIGEVKKFKTNKWTKVNAAVRATFLGAERDSLCRVISALSDQPSSDLWTLTANEPLARVANF